MGKKGLEGDRLVVRDNVVVEHIPDDDRPTEWYRQGDERWGNELIGNEPGYPMRDWGCLITAIAQAINEHGTQFSPLDYVRATQKEPSGYLANNGLGQLTLVKYAPIAELSGGRLVYSALYDWRFVPADVALINQKIEQGLVLFVQVPHPTFGTHYLRLLETNADGTHNAYDPYHGDVCVIENRFANAGSFARMVEYLVEFKSPSKILL